MEKAQVACGIVIGTAADIDVRTGFQADVIKLINLTDFSTSTWYRALLDENAIAGTASGTLSLAVSTGVNLIKIDGPVGSEVVTVLEASGVKGLFANGFRIESDAGVNDDAELIWWEAIASQRRFIRAVHDGTTSSNYLEDRSLDFRELGVTAGWVVVNFTNDNRGVVDEIQRPTGQTRYCRLTIAGGVAAADFDTADVCFIMPPEEEQITAITAMA